MEIEGVLKQNTLIYLSSGLTFQIPAGRKVRVEGRVLKIEDFPFTFTKLNGKFWCSLGEEVIFPEGGKTPFPFLLLNITRPKSG